MDYETDVRHVLSAIHVPTLILHREEDDPEANRYLAEHIRGAEYVALPGKKHVAYVGSLEGAGRPVVDQELGPRYEAIGPPVFTPTGVTFAAVRDGVIYRATASGTDRPA